jgi:DNA-binding LytR/AlgR family response regulator
MNPARILIVEDEFIIATNLKNMLEDLGYEPYAPAGSKKEALRSLQENEVDLAILDINLDGKQEGIEIGQYIHDHCNFPFIYLTSNSDRNTINEARQTRPGAYLIKPFTEEDIFAAIEVAIGSYTEHAGLSDDEFVPLVSDSLFVKNGNKFIKVKISEITHFEADGKTVMVHTLQHQKLQVRCSLENLLTQLQGFGFVRVHRGFCINSEHLSAINNEFVYIDDQNIPIGRVYKDELLKRIKTII